MNLILIKLGAALALVLAIFGAGHHFGARGVQSDWDADKLSRTSHENDAIHARVEQNASLATAQTATNATITKAKDEELAPVVKRIYVDRVRVGPALCGGPAAPAKAESTSGSDGTDPAGRLVRDDLERDLRALEIRVEEAMATGRACQAFVTKNDLIP